MSNENTWVLPEDLTLGLGPYIRFQLLVFCHVNNIHVSPADLSIMTLIGMVGKPDLAMLCKKVKELEILTSSGGIRNSIDVLQSKGLIVKEGNTARKKVYLNTLMNITGKGNKQYNIKCNA